MSIKKAEPMNSYEVSYVLSKIKPAWDLKISKEELEQKLPLSRRWELEDFIKTINRHEWAVYHK